MTEQQPYDVLRSDGRFEVRRYPAHVVAETTVSGDFDSAGNRAFRYLFGYISGQNADRRSIEMTSPVVQSASRSIAMTAPVTQSAAGADFTVAFVLPTDFSEASAPLPTRSEVSLRTVPARVVAALRYTGRWTAASYDKHRSELMSALAGASLTPVGEPWFARFDPPYTPWFLRRNEVLVQVAEPALP